MSDEMDMMRLRARVDFAHCNVETAVGLLREILPDGEGSIDVLQAERLHMLTDMVEHYLKDMEEGLTEERRCRPDS